MNANAFEAGFKYSIATTATFTITPAAFFTTPGSFTNHAFDVQWVGLTGKGYILQGSTDLVNWIPLGTNAAGATTFNFVDPGSSNLPRRFYRTLQQP